MTLTAGARLGPYEIVAPLGAGGMGEVYRAKDTRLERTVAIKVLSARLSSSAEVRQRFEREAKTISQLSHPHICALYDVGREGETEFLVMEYLEGDTLAGRLVRGALPLEQSVKYGIEIADALDKAHRQGIVHRDLKPGNMMLTKSGVKLLDFGLAKAIAPAGPTGGVTELPTQAALTHEGAILGTFQYMAPEQLEGKEADARTDVFALGSVLYEMVTGRKTFPATTQASLIGAILHKDPEPISKVEPTTPASLDRVVRRCLAKDPEQRWQSARDVALELAEVTRSDESATPTPVRRSRNAAVGWLAAAVLLIALLAVVLWPSARRTVESSARMRFTIPPPPQSSLQGMLALSPTGDSLVFVATTPDGSDVLWTRRLDSLAARRLDGTEGASYPFWSPDGRFIAFFARGKLKKVDAAGGSPQTLCDAAAPRGGSWGSRGTIVFSANAGGEIDRVPETGGRATAIPHLTSRDVVSYRWPSFLPDGRHILVFVLGADAAGTGVAAVSLDDPKERAPIVPGDSGALHVDPGSILYRSGDRLVAQPFDAQRLRAAGEPTPVVEDVWWDAISTLATAFTASRTGVLAYQTGGLGSSRLVLYDRTGRELRTVGPDGAYLEPAISPDGRALLIGRAEASATGSGTVIWMIDLERNSLTRMAFEPVFATATPLWSPDGKRIVYSAFPSGEVFVRNPRGAEKAKILFKAASFRPLDDWSRDGRYLFYERIEWPSFRFSVGVRDLSNGTESGLLDAPFNQMSARLSPDGRWLAYESQESGDSEIFIQSFPQKEIRTQVSSGGGTQPRWSGDGHELFYVSRDRKLMVVKVSTTPKFEARTPEALFQTQILPTVEARNHYDVTPDGQRFIVNSRRPEDASLPITVIVGWTATSKK